jgi:hypothetical protein
MPTKEELYDLATAYHIEGRSTMSKAELIQAIKDAGGAIPEDEEDAGAEAEAEAEADERDAARSVRLRDLYTAYAESVSETQHRYAAEQSALVDRLREELAGLAEDATKANPLPAYLRDVSEAYYAGDQSRLSEANRKLLKHVLDMETMVERRYSDAARTFIEEFTELYRRTRDDYLAQASTYSDRVQAEWKSVSPESAYSDSVGVLQHSLLVGTAARTLGALG